MSRATLDIPAPRSLNRTRGRHHMAEHRERERLRLLIAQTLQIAGVPRPVPGDRVHATAHLTFPTRRPRDEGNFRAPLEKALGDALVPKPSRRERELVAVGIDAAPRLYLTDDTPEHFTFGAVTFTVAPGLPTCAITLLWGDDLPPAFPAHPHPPGDPRT